MAVTFLLALGLLAPAQDPADDQYHFLVGLHEKGLYDLAVKEAQAFLQVHPRHGKADLARYRLASSLFELDQRKDAAPHFRQLSGKRGFAYRAESAFRLGQCELSAERHEAAAQAFALTLQLDEDYLEIPASFLLGEAEFRRDEFENAERLYALVLANPEGAEYARECRYGLAWCAFRQDRFDDTVQRVEAFLRHHGKDELVPEMKFLLGEAHLEAGRPEPARRAYAQVDRGSFQDAALRGAGFASARLKDHESAAAAFGGLRRRFPQSRFVGEATLHQGIHLLQAEKATQAVEVLRSEQAQVTPELLYWRGRAESKAGQTQAALSSLDRALRGAEADSDLAGRIQVARGDVLFELNRLDEAAGAYTESGSDYALHAAAVASLNSGESARAIILSRKLIEDHPDSEYRIHAQLTLGEGLLDQKQYKEAEAAFIPATRENIEPAQRSRAIARSAWCRYLLDDKQTAAQRFAFVVREYPKSEEFEDSLFMTGRARQESGDPKGAVTAWTGYLRQFPEGEHRAEALLGLSRLQPGEAGQAHLESLLTAHEDSELAAPALYELAERHSGRQDWKQAERHFRTFLSRYSKHELAPAAHYGLGWSLYQMQQYSDATQQLRRAAMADEVAKDLRLAALELLVWAERKADQPERAAEAWRLFNAECSDEQRRYQAGRTAAAGLKEAGRLDAADAIHAEMQKNVRNASAAAGVRIERVYLALEQDRFEEAEKLVQMAQQLDPKDGAVAEAFFFVGEACFEKGEFDKAASYYEVAAKNEDCPVIPNALYKQGFAHLRREDFERAASSFQSLVEAYPNSELYGESLFLLGEAHYRLEQYPQAVAAHELLREKVANHQVIPKALFRLGIVYCKVEDYEPAEAALSDLARRFPKFENAVEAELWRGRSLLGLENLRAARQAFERVIARDRGILAARARLGLGHSHLASENVDQALSEFLKVAVLYAHSEEVAEGLYYAGRCLEASGDQGRAVKQYQEILSKHADTAYSSRAADRLKQLGAQ